jgi:hypothetical protein
MTVETGRHTRQGEKALMLTALLVVGVLLVALLGAALFVG